MFSAEIIGTEGVILLRHPLSKSRLAIRSSILAESKGEWYFPEITEPNKGTGEKRGGLYHHKLFIADILNNTWNSASIEDGIATLKVVLAAHEAAEKGIAVEIMA